VVSGEIKPILISVAKSQDSVLGLPGLRGVDPHDSINLMPGLPDDPPKG
jgi:hypothetical protein